MEKNRTIKFKNKPRIVSYASIAGKKEGEGPLRNYFDKVLEDAIWDEDSWEKTERKMFKWVVETAAAKGNIQLNDIDVLVGGDLLNQIISAAFAARDLNMCFLGQYGACSTMAQSLIIGGVLTDGGYFEKVACGASSHFATAERQYRFPLEMGCQRPPTAQRTVTGAGCSILSLYGDSSIHVTKATIGRVIDWKIDDANNMGAVMAPSAADTLACHFKNSNTVPGDYDLIITGDLGFHGMELCKQIIMEEHGISLGSNYTDCGCEIFTKDMGVDCGGSGCGCSASVLNGYLLDEMEKGKYKKILFMSTGALLSPTSSMQNDTIPGVAHCVVIERLEDE